MTKFIQHCEDCPQWTKWVNSRLVGTCKKYDQARHNLRELCSPMWTQEIKRLAKLIGAKDSQVKIILLEKAVLDPKRTMEACGFEWPEHEKAKTSKKSPRVSGEEGQATTDQV